MGTKRNHRELGAAWASDELVALRRTIWKGDIVEGYVVDLGDEWAALNIVYDVGLNGWSVVRLDTVSEVERLDSQSFLPRALAQFGELPEPIDVDLTSCRSIVRCLSATFPLITVFTEGDDPRSCAVGRPLRATKSKIHLLDITAEATWETDRPRKFRYRDVTRIDVGGRFETALHELGGFPPVAP